MARLTETKSTPMGPPVGKRGRTKRPVGIWDPFEMTAFDPRMGIAATDGGRPVAFSASSPPVTAVTASTQLSNGLIHPRQGENGYYTGNASFLHVYISGAHADTTQNAGVVVHGYNYDIGKWGELEVPAGHNGPVRNDGRSKTLNLQSDGYTPAAVRIGPGGSAVMRTVDIKGIDRVAFVLTGSTAPTRFDVRVAVSSD